MKIGILCRSDCGGSSHIAVEKARELARQGHRVHLFSLCPPFWLNGSPDGLVTHVVHDKAAKGTPNLREKMNWSNADAENIIRQISDVIKEERLDILHVHYAFPFVYLALKIKACVKGRRPRLVATLHGTDVSILGTDPIRNRNMSAALGRFDSLTTVSMNHARLAKTTFGLPKEPAVILNFVDTTVFHPVDKADHRRKPILAHVSNFSPVKDCPGAVKIFALLREKMEASLWLLGDGEQRQTVANMLRARGLLCDTRFFGRCREVAALLPQTDVMLMPSRAESFGLAALESMACGVPVVASRVGGLQEVVLHKKSGFLFEPGDYAGASRAVSRILLEPGLHTSLRRTSRVQACRYSREKIVTQYLDMYEETLKQS